jgi:hypothetical protein
MKRIGLIGLMLMAAIAAIAAPPVEMQVTTNAIKILPERNLGRGYGTVWSVTNAVAQGDIIRWGTDQYMAENAGALGTNAPTLSVSGAETNGAVILRYVEKGPRLGFILMLNTEGSVRVNLNAAAVPGKGIQLEGKKSIWQESDRGAPQGAIWAVSDSGTNSVSALEW